MAFVKSSHGGDQADALAGLSRGTNGGTRDVDSCAGIHVSGN
jgi:hypothetical protein